MKQERKWAVRDAKSAIMEKASNDPSKFADGLLANPELLHGITGAREILSTLFNKGQQEKLELMLANRRTPPFARKIITELLLGI